MSSILWVKSVSIAVGVVVIYIEVVVVDGSNHFTYKKDDSKAHQSMRKQSYADFHASIDAKSISTFDSTLARNQFQIN